MSEHHAEVKTVDLKQIGRVGLIVAILGAVGLIVGFTTSAETTLQSYLFGWVIACSFAVGSLGLTLLHHTVRGSWGLSVLRIFEGGGGWLTFAVLGVLALPILLNLGSLYHHWMVFFDAGHTPPNDPVIYHKTGYLNPSMFWLRTVGYFAFFAAIAWGLRKSSLRQDKSGDIREQWLRTNWSAPSMVFFVLAVTFASTDWIMSLDPHWFSTIFGLWYLISGALGALAFAVLIVCVFAKEKPFVNILTPALTKDLGNMLFVLTLLWAYVSLSQYIIIWSGNLPEFITFYDTRSKEYWTYWGLANILLSFAVPFFYLLAPKMKRTAATLIPICGLILFMRVFDMAYNVLPLMRLNITWQDIAAVVTMGGMWVFLTIQQIAGHALYPEHDLRLIEAAEHQHA